MNRQGADGITWTDWTWNPISGCLHGCWFCYARKMYRRFPALGNPDFVPMFFPERLKELGLLKKPSKIFVCSTADLFASWTKSEWRNAVLEKVYQYPQHTYQLLTKQPQNILPNYHFGSNVWVGCTVTGVGDIHLIKYIKRLRRCGVRFVSFEPLLVPVDVDLSGIDWIIIGKLTGSKKVPLNKKAVSDLILQAREKGIPVFVKNNVGWRKKIQEFPIGVN